MSAAADAAIQQLVGFGPRADTPPPPPPPVAFHYTQTDSFVALLHELGASLLVSTYQANKLLTVRANCPGLSTLVRTFDKPMGLAVDFRRLALGTRKEVWLLRNAPDIAPRIEPLQLTFHSVGSSCRATCRPYGTISAVSTTGRIGRRIAWMPPPARPSDRLRRS